LYSLELYSQQHLAIGRGTGKPVLEQFCIYLNSKLEDRESEKVYAGTVQY